MQGRAWTGRQAGAAALRPAALARRCGRLVDKRIDRRQFLAQNGVQRGLRLLVVVVAFRSSSLACCRSTLAKLKVQFRTQLCFCKRANLVRGHLPRGDGLLRNARMAWLASA